MAKKAPISGEGQLKFGSVQEQVQYTYVQTSSVSRAAKGSLTGDPDKMRQAFHSGDAVLSVEDGRRLRVQIVAHAEGSQTAYYEMRSKDF